MAVTTHDTVFETRPRKGRSKGMAAIRKLRRALARRRLEEMREEKDLQENIYDVFSDDS